MTAIFESGGDEEDLPAHSAALEVAVRVGRALEWASVRHDRLEVACVHLPGEVSQIVG